MLQFCCAARELDIHSDMCGVESIVECMQKVTVAVCISENVNMFVTKCRVGEGKKGEAD